MNNTQKTGLLVISRHAESEWNLLGKWTGLTDVGLSPKGHADARLIGQLLRDINFDVAFTSDLIRTQQTLDGILEGKQNQADLRRVAYAALNERDYGDLTGMNKWDVLEKLGEEEFTGIRRGWNHPIPHGETLADVYQRVVPYFQKDILPLLQAGNTVLLVAHGNSIRALMKYLEDISEQDMASVEMSFGEVLMYTFDSKTDKPVDKQVRKIETEKTHA